MLILSRWPIHQYDKPILLDATKNHTNEIFKTLFKDFKKLGLLILRVDNATSSILVSKRILHFIFWKKNFNIVIDFSIIYKSIKKSYKLLSPP